MGAPFVEADKQADPFRPLLSETAKRGFDAVVKQYPGIEVTATSAIFCVVSRLPIATMGAKGSVGRPKSCCRPRLHACLPRMSSSAYVAGIIGS